MSDNIPAIGNIIEYVTKRDVNGNSRRLYVGYGSGRVIRTERYRNNRPDWVTNWLGRTGIHPERIEVTPTQWRELLKREV